METERLRLDFATEADLPRLLEIFHSNPHYVEWTEGGVYDLEMLREDWKSARETDGRHMLALRDRESGDTVGVLEYLEVNPDDGHPWIGLIMIGAERQHEGLAAEAMEAIFDRIALNWASPIRLGVIDENSAGLALAISLGFEPYGEAVQELGGGEQRLVLLQRRR
jgi:RimJ/RimL family protein N-acetyltransferase